MHSYVSDLRFHYAVCNFIFKEKKKKERSIRYSNCDGNDNMEVVKFSGGGHVPTKAEVGKMWGQFGRKYY